MYNFVTCKVCYHVLVVTFPMPHDTGCEIKIIVIVIVLSYCSFLKSKSYCSKLPGIL